MSSLTKLNKRMCFPTSVTWLDIDHEWAQKLTLQSSAVFGQTPNSVQNEINNFFANCIMPSGIVVRCVFFSSDHLFWMEQMLISTSTYLVWKVLIQHESSNSAWHQKLSNQNIPVKSSRWLYNLFGICRHPRPIMTHMNETLLYRNKHWSFFTKIRSFLHFSLEIFYVRQINNSSLLWPCLLTRSASGLCLSD